MTYKRNEKLGIKQTIQKHWMDKTVQMLLVGMSEKEIRSELDQYLSTQKQSGGEGKRGEKTYRMALSILASWFAPKEEFRLLRDDALQLAGKFKPQDWVPMHWAVISSAYPFWLNTAKQVGRLLALQSQITQSQVFDRLKEHYGDRETVARNARYAIRSFVAWGVLAETEKKGVYSQGNQSEVTDVHMLSLIYEALMYGSSDNRSAWSELVNSPSLFPFTVSISTPTPEMIQKENSRIHVQRYDLDHAVLNLL